MKYKKLIKTTPLPHSIEKYTTKEIGGIIQKVAKKVNSNKLKECDFVWAIDKFLAKETITMIYGRAGSGKSLFNLHLSHYLIKKQIFNKIYYFDGDNPIVVLKARGLERILSLTRDNLEYHMVENRKILLKQLTSYTGSLKDTLFIFDNIKDFINGDMSKDLVVNKAMSYLKKLRDNGATVIFLNHQPKQSITGENNKNYKGSTAFADNSDEAYFLSTKEIVENELIFTLEPLKNRFGTKKSSFLVDLDNLTFKRDNTKEKSAEKNSIEEITLKAIKLILQDNKQGIISKIFVSKLEKLSRQEDIEIYRGNSLWKFIEKFNGVHWIIKSKNSISKRIEPLNFDDFSKDEKECYLRHYLPQIKYMQNNDDEIIIKNTFIDKMYKKQKISFSFHQQLLNKVINKKIVSVINIGRNKCALRF